MLRYIFTYNSDKAADGQFVMKPHGKRAREREPGLPIRSFGHC